MSKLITSSPSQECGVCFDASGKCRHGHEINLCMLFADAKIGEIINGYKLLKHSKDGMWGVFKIDNTQEWSEQQREQWRLDRERRKQQQKLEDDLRQKQSLSVIEKDKEYQRVFDELTLHPEDEKDLLGRGLTHQEIQLGGWKSVDQYHELKQQYSHLLPGISPDGRVILTNSGWLCAVRNKDGLIVGIQVRLRVVPIGEGRYRWLSSKTKQNPNGQSPHIYPLGANDGELPLASFYPEGEPKGIALAEGVGVKPFYVAQRLGMLTLGAAGGQWASSPVSFKESLDHFSKKMDNLKSITIYVDAGDVLNKLVVGRWKKTVRLLQEWDWTVRIAWWGQITKEHGDIDEISSTEIQYICAKEFFAIADKQLKLIDQQKQTANKASEKRNEIEQLTTIRQRLTHITEIPYRVVNVPHMREVLKDLIEPGTVNIIISDTGTGKTESVKPFADKSEAFYSWHNRRSLGRKMSGELGLNYKDDISGNGQKKKAAFCAPSAYQFEPKNLSNGGILLFDECDQVFDFIFGSLCNKEGIRPLLLSTLEAHFQSAIAGNGIVLCMSADTTQKEIDYIKAVTPEGTPVRLIINKYQPKRPDIHLDISPTPEGLLDLLVENLKAGINCFVLDDMKDGVKGCKSIAEYVRQELKDVADLTLEIHSDSMDDPNVQEFVQSADKKSEQYRFVVTSPSIISGLSLKNQRFVNGVFAFCNGILGDREIKQFLNRVRGAEDIYMWIAEEGYPPRGVNPDLVTPQEVHDYYQRNYAANSKHILSLKTDYDPMTNGSIPILQKEGEKTDLFASLTRE